MESFTCQVENWQGAPVNFLKHDRIMMGVTSEKMTLKKTLMLGKIEGRIRGGKQKMRWLDGITNSMNMSLSTWMDRHCIWSYFLGRLSLVIILSVLFCSHQTCNVSD